MPKRLVLPALCLLLLASLALAGCGATKTVTLVLTDTSAAPNATITRTVVQALAPNDIETSLVLLTGEPPKVPHGTTVGGMYGPCFSCHPIPAGHTGRIAQEDVCSQCHQQGPIDPNLL